jgi:endonuclease/exonuclease/phosphatase family metal-dependent hydrolase
VVRHAGRVIRVATFNLLHGRSLRDGGTDPANLAAAAEELAADIIGLQEVDHGQARSGKVDQTAVIAETLGTSQWRFAPSVHGTPGEEWSAADGELVGPGDPTDGPAYGVGLVSRFPVVRWKVHRFPAARASLPLLVPAQPRPRLLRVPDEPRSVIAAAVSTPHGLMTVVTAHLSFVPGTNARQLRQIRSLLAGWPRPLLLLGDFNLPGALPARLTGMTRLAAVPTYPSWGPRVQFDHILGEGIGRDRVGEVRSSPLAVSDHCGLSLELLPPR